MVKKHRVVVTQDGVDAGLLRAGMESQGNAIPVAVAAVLRIVAPVVARMAVRYVARKYRKNISDTAVNTASQWAGTQVQGIIDRAKAHPTTAKTK